MEVFHRISGQVKAYSYLVEWIVRDITNGVNLVVREIQERIPASSIFEPGSQWEVMPLSKPYSGGDSWSEPWGTATAVRPESVVGNGQEAVSKEQTQGDPKKPVVRKQKPPTPAPWEPKEGDGYGPRSPDVSKPDTKDLLKRMAKQNPNESKRYRQRTGE